jgi:hypothetical protein
MIFDALFPKVFALVAAFEEELNDVFVITLGKHSIKIFSSNNKSINSLHIPQGGALSAASSV